MAELVSSVQSWHLHCRDSFLLRGVSFATAEFFFLAESVTSVQSQFIHYRVSFFITTVLHSHVYEYAPIFVRRLRQVLHYRGSLQYRVSMLLGQLLYYKVKSTTPESVSLLRF